VGMLRSRFKLPAPVAGHHLGPLGKTDKLLAIGMRKSFSVPGRVSAADAFIVFFKLAQLTREIIGRTAIRAGREKSAIVANHYFVHSGVPFVEKMQGLLCATSLEKK